MTPIFGSRITFSHGNDLKLLDVRLIMFLRNIFVAVIFTDDALTRHDLLLSCKLKKGWNRQGICHVFTILKMLCTFALSRGVFKVNLRTMLMCWEVSLFHLREK